MCGVSSPDLVTRSWAVAAEAGFLPRVRLVWGRIENFKCVDYFYVEYFQRRDPAGTVRRSARISRDRRSLEIEVC